MPVLTIYFANCGQDFLEFDISNEMILTSRPGESTAWRHFQVITPENEIRPGIRLKVRSRQHKDAPVMTIKHPIMEVERQLVM